MPESTLPEGGSNSVTWSMHDWDTCSNACCDGSHTVHDWSMTGIDSPHCEQQHQCCLALEFNPTWHKHIELLWQKWHIFWIASGLIQRTHARCLFFRPWRFRWQHVQSKAVRIGCSVWKQFNQWAHNLRIKHKTCHFAGHTASRRTALLVSLSCRNWKGDCVEQCFPCGQASWWVLAFGWWDSCPLGSQGWLACRQLWWWQVGDEWWQCAFCHLWTQSRETAERFSMFLAQSSRSRIQPRDWPQPQQKHACTVWRPIQGCHFQWHQNVGQWGVSKQNHNAQRKWWLQIMGAQATLLLSACPIHRIQKKQARSKCKLNSAIRRTMTNSKRFGVLMTDSAATQMLLLLSLIFRCRWEPIRMG